MTPLSDPNYYVLIDFATIDTDLFDLPTALLGKHLYLVRFQAAGLESPKSEPIGVFHYAGIRRFIWKDKYYTEYHLNHRSMITRAAELIIETHEINDALVLQNLLALLKQYGQAEAPNFDSTYDEILADPELRMRRFVRAIYQIE